MDATESTFSANSNEHECPICLSPFTEPKILLCGHIMCRVCLVTWIRARDLQVDCPLCRHPIFELFIVAVPDDFVSLVVDSLPTDHVMRATARGKIDLSPETCSGCENLLCSSRSSQHPKCPGQDVQNTEADTRAALKDLSDKVQVMMETSNKLQKYLKDLEDEFHGLVDVNKSKSLEQVQTMLFVSWYKNQTGKLHSVLLTHKHLLQRMGDSHQVVATILMRKPMQDRVEQIRRKLDLLNHSFLRGSQCVRASWKK